MTLGPFEKHREILKEMPFPEGFRLAGWVYILSNEYMPGIYKVGMTTTSPQARARELSSSTGVPYPFKVEAAYHCADPAYSESEIHESLSEYRINNSREFFKLDLQDLKYACDEFCDAEVGIGAEHLAVTHDVISFESLDRLNIDELFDDIDLVTFGDRLAIAERLIRIGAERVRNYVLNENITITFHDGKAYAIQNPEWTEMQEQYERRMQQIEHEESLGIYGPVIPPKETPIPF
ncbi:GIY-YIG nuclease family protein [Tatumella morbirosei]|uniref:GIY-YIG nuclease family protein n=1 Tax=Tatumella morbirosei TaxID=642227 RepID=UPI00069A3461|nr:GIY-YIG nuclease family protein [Tatumella morbirosei]